MGCTIVFVILLVIGIGILCFLTGDMTAFIALAATLVIGLVLPVFCIAFIGHGSGGKGATRCHLLCAG